MTKTLTYALALVALLLTAAGPALATEGHAPVKVVVLLETGIGGGTQAQGFLDRFLGVVAERSGWSATESKYTTKRSRALKYISRQSPQLGLFSLAAFLELQATQQLDVVGEAIATAAGGRRYYLVAKTGAGLDTCKGQTLASNHLGDPRFVDNVVFAGAARLAEFRTTKTRRPVQTLKAVIRDQARCALIDDAQLAALEGIEGGETLEPVWTSAELPPIPIVAFPNAPAPLRKEFVAALEQVCVGEGAETCANIGVQALRKANQKVYDDVIALYRSNEVAKP
ncbi:MAG: hypothetical protein CSA66_04765 [Proteobacteria bacterium]|nr:MAG: hypothetical protein CSA66_04765 [Pseudomonadota bacterium]